MLDRVWDIRDFRKRYVLYYLIVLAAVIFFTSPLIVVKWSAFVVFILLSTIFLRIVTSYIITILEQIKFKFTLNRSSIRLPLSAVSPTLSKTGVSVKELILVKGANAYVMGNSLVLGMDLLKRLDFNELQAVIAHELGHILRRHAVIKTAWSISLFTVLLLGWPDSYPPIIFSEAITEIVRVVMLNISMLAFLFWIMVPVNWYVEHDADRFAARLIGKEYIKSVLLKLADEKNSKEPTETHPSIVERIRQIDRIEQTR